MQEVLRSWRNLQWNHVRKLSFDGYQVGWIHREVAEFLRGRDGIFVNPDLYVNIKCEAQEAEEDAKGRGRHSSCHGHEDKFPNTNPNQMGGQKGGWSAPKGSASVATNGGSRLDHQNGIMRLCFILLNITDPIKKKRK